QERGDQIVIETLPFESTLLLEPPALPKPPGGGTSPGPIPVSPLQFFQKMDSKMRIIAGAGAGALLLILVVAIFLLRRRSAKKKKKQAAEAKTPVELPGPENAAAASVPAVAAPGAVAPPGVAEKQIENRLAEREALQQKMDAQALNALKLAPVI